MRPALYGKLQRLASPLTPDGFFGEYCALFAGTTEQAKQCALLASVVLPGEPGVSKTTRTLRLSDGRKVRVWRRAERVSVSVWTTDAEDQEAEEDVRRRQADAKALAQAAAYDKLASNVMQTLKEQPATEAEFRELAKEAFWRMWFAFRLGFLGDRQRHASGFRYTAATVDMLHAFAHSIAWALEGDGTVLLDEDRRFGELRSALGWACKHDLPLQRFLDQVKAAAPLEQEGGAS